MLLCLKLLPSKLWVILALDVHGSCFCRELKGVPFFPYSIFLFTSHLGRWLLICILNLHKPAILGTNSCNLWKLPCCNLRLTPCAWPRAILYHCRELHLPIIVESCMIVKDCCILWMKLWIFLQFCVCVDLFFIVCLSCIHIIHICVRKGGF